MKLPVTRTERTMKNGLRVVVLHKPDFARSLFMLGVPAGGCTLMERSRQGICRRRPGSAHFLEHQMFRLHGQDVTPQLADVQARSNAFTSYDETCYFVSTNSDPFPALNLLIDFVQTLDIDHDSVEKEKGIILSEFLQYDQEPESRLLSMALRSLYHSHPMKTEILGQPEDIKAMTAEDLQAFYKAWYDPARMVLVAISSQKPEAIFEAVEKQEEKYPSRLNLQTISRRIFEPEPHAIAQACCEAYMDVDVPFACLAVKLDPVADVQQAVRQDYLINLFLESRFSSLSPHYQSWIDSRLIGGMMGAEADLKADHGYMLIYAQTDRPEEFIRIMSEQLSDPAPVSRETFDSLLRREKASSIRLLEQYEALASSTISGCFAGYDPLDDLRILDSLSVEELNDWIRTLDMSRQTSSIIRPLTVREETDKTV